MHCCGPASRSTTVGTTSVPEEHLQVSGLSSQAQEIVVHARDSDGYTSAVFVGHRWALGTSELLGCNRSIIGKKSMFMPMHQVLHFHRIYCHFCITWTFQSLVLTIQYSRYFRLLTLNIRAFEQILALFNALTTHRFPQDLLHLWLNKAEVVNSGTINKTNLQNAVLQPGRNLGFSPTTLQ